MGKYKSFHTHVEGCKHLCPLYTAQILCRPVATPKYYPISIKFLLIFFLKCNIMGECPMKNSTVHIYESLYSQAHLTRVLHDFCPKNPPPPSCFKFFCMFYFTCDHCLKRPEWVVLASAWWGSWRRGSTQLPPSRDRVWNNRRYLHCPSAHQQCWTE